MGYRKLGRRGDHRRAMLRNQVTSLLQNERIKTTECKAKEVRSIADQMITLAKRGDLSARRQALRFIYDKGTVQKLFTTIGPKYEDRSGGYTRITKLGTRRGDAAQMVILELV